MVRPNFLGNVERHILLAKTVLRCDSGHFLGPRKGGRAFRAMFQCAKQTGATVTKLSFWLLFVIVKLIFLFFCAATNFKKKYSNSTVCNYVKKLLTKKFNSKIKNFLRIFVDSTFGVFYFLGVVWCLIRVCVWILVFYFFVFDDFKVFYVFSTKSTIFSEILDFLWNSWFSTILIKNNLNNNI